MRLKKWLGMEKSKVKESPKRERVNPHIPPTSKRNKKKMEIQKDKDVDRIQYDISKLSDEVKKNNEYISMLARSQVDMIRSQKNSNRRSNAIRVFRKGMEAMSAKPISREEFRKKAFSTEYLDRTAPRRKVPTVRKGGPSA